MKTVGDPIRELQLEYGVDIDKNRKLLTPYMDLIEICLLQILRSKGKPNTQEAIEYRKKLINGYLDIAYEL